MKVTFMQSLSLEKQDWQRLFDHISRTQKMQKITIEVIRADLGAQTEAEKVELDGMSYDPKGGTISIQVRGLEHMIQDPEKIEIAHAGTDIVCVEIIGKDDTHHLISFLPPLHLPDLLPSLSC
jgi:hypothetical protein